MAESKTKIVVFLCKWSSFPGDQTGVEAKNVTCAAKVDPAAILGAFLDGADGVFVPGCHPVDCDHVKGVFHTERNMKISRQLMEAIGLNGERLFFDWVPVDKGERLGALVSQFVAKMGEMGPLGAAEKIEMCELEKRLRAAADAAGTKRIKWLIGKEELLVNRKNKFGESVPQEFYDTVTDDAVKEEYLASSIALFLEEQPMSVKELAGKIGIQSNRVLMGLMELRTSGRVGVSEVRGKSPLYKLK